MEQMDRKTRNAMRRIVEYLERDELYGWAEEGCPDEEHIFLDVVRLKVWLENGIHASSKELQAAYECELATTKNGWGEKSVVWRKNRRSERRMNQATATGTRARK